MRTTTYPSTVAVATEKLKTSMKSVKFTREDTSSWSNAPKVFSDVRVGEKNGVKLRIWVNPSTKDFICTAYKAVGTYTSKSTGEERTKWGAIAHYASNEKLAKKHEQILSRKRIA